MKSNFDDDDDDDDAKAEGYFVRSTGREYSFYLSGPIGPPSKYIKWFDCIRNAGPSDDVIVHINSGGGVLDTAIQFLRVLSETQAHITTSVEGSCMSAASIIFLQGDTIQITPNSLFMFHNYSGGCIGKGGELYDNIVFERKWSEKFLHHIYDGFLTDAEITSMLENKDIWMDAEEVTERCTKYKRLRSVDDKKNSLEE